jgi:hypothetical protein
VRNFLPQNRSTRRWWQAGFAALLVVIMLGANVSATGDDGTERFDKVGHKLMCICGCGQVLVECNHVGCPDSARMTGELRKELASHAPGGVAGSINPAGPAGPTTPTGGGAASSGIGGGSTIGDSAVLAWFTAKYGGMVLAAPIRGGFDNVAWIIPIALFILATIGTAVLVRLWSARQRPALAGAGQFAGTIDDSLRERIRRETEY